jgi:hypothetical protein
MYLFCLRHSSISVCLTKTGESDVTFYDPRQQQREHQNVVNWSTRFSPVKQLFTVHCGTVEPIIKARVK